MTTDRDIRFNEEQMRLTAVALRAEILKRNRSIEKAIAAQAAGATIQHNTLDHHYKMRDVAKQVMENLRVAEQQMERKHSS
jgi:hypothetical protein